SLAPGPALSGGQRRNSANRATFRKLKFESTVFLRDFHETADQIQTGLRSRSSRFCNTLIEHLTSLGLQRPPVFCGAQTEAPLRFLLQVSNRQTCHAINVIIDCIDRNGRYFFRNASRLTISAGAAGFSDSFAGSGTGLGPGLHAARAGGAGLFAGLAASAP